MFRQDCSHHLLTTILPFWENLTDWERGGWFGYVNHDLSVERGAHKGCILNSRILWTFSTAARVTGDKSLLRYARHAFAFLPHFEDTERGGVYWSVTADGEPLDKTKHTYCQAFAIYGLAAYMRAIGESDPDYAPARDKAMALFRLIETKCSDAGGYGEAYEPDFTPVGNEKLSDNPKLMERHETASRIDEHAAARFGGLCGIIPRHAGRSCAPRRRSLLRAFPERDVQSWQAPLGGLLRPQLPLFAGHAVLRARH